MQAIFVAALALAPGQPGGPITEEPPPYRPDAPRRGLGGFGTPPSPVSEPTVEQRKDVRDAVAAALGAESVAFMRKYGDAGIAALARCSPGTGRKVVALYTAGNCQTLSSPGGVVAVIATHGEPAAVWALANFDRLLDIDVMRAWEESPMEYVYDLRDLNHQAELNAAYRKYAPARAQAARSAVPPAVTSGMAMIAGIALLLAGFVWRMRQRGF